MHVLVSDIVQIKKGFGLPDNINKNSNITFFVS